jgi:hypothetical protein
VTTNLELIARRLGHLERMAGYLAYSHAHALPILPISDWDALTPAQHETLAAFRLRFSEFQEHLGKIMRAVAIEEESSTEPFGAVLAFMEKLGIIDSVDHWKFIRELRNAVNHEYEENAQRLSEFFTLLIEETPKLMSFHEKLAAFCGQHYGIYR